MTARALLLAALSACAHTPPPPPGEPCPPWQAGWIESRAECDVWRCNAASLRWERLEVCE